MGKLRIDTPTTSADAYARTEEHIMKTKAVKAMVSNQKADKDFTKRKKKDENLKYKKEFTHRKESYLPRDLYKKEEKLSTSLNTERF